MLRAVIAPPDAPLEPAPLVAGAPPPGAPPEPPLRALSRRVLECVGPSGGGGGADGAASGGAASGGAAALPLGWAALESALHALSAAAKPLGARESAEVAAVMRRLPAVGAHAATLMARGGGAAGAGRQLLATSLVLLGAYVGWLAAPGRRAELSAVVPLLLSSLSVSEDDGSGWLLRSKQARPLPPQRITPPRRALGPAPLRSLGCHLLCSSPLRSGQPRPAASSPHRHPPPPPLPPRCPAQARSWPPQ